MNLYTIFEKYEEIESDIYDLITHMKDREYPDLIVVEKETPKELEILEVFEKKDIAPLTGGKQSRLHEGIVEYYIYNDKDENGQFTPLIPNKYVTYKKEKLAPGLFIITLEYGIKTRKGDFRFVDKINNQKEQSYFLFENNQYNQVNPQKEQWLDRLKERDELKKQTMSFIYFYQNFKNTIWKKKINSFDTSKFIYSYTDEMKKLGEIEFIETINFFLNISELYLFILKFFGSITSDEHDYLLKAIDRQKSYNNKCYEYITLREEELLSDFASILNLPTNEPFYEIKFKMATLLTPREERLDIVTPNNYHQGYVYIDTEKNGGICYPNLGEIERRINLYRMAGNYESEQEITRKIIKIAKQQKK